MNHFLEAADSVGGEVGPQLNFFVCSFLRSFYVLVICRFCLLSSYVLEPQLRFPDAGSTTANTRENGHHVGRNHVGRFARTVCAGMLVQAHGLHL